MKEKVDLLHQIAIRMPSRVSECIKLGFCLYDYFYYAQLCVIELTSNCENY